MDTDPELENARAALQNELAWTPGLGWLWWNGKVWNQVGTVEPALCVKRWAEETGRPLSATRRDRLVHQLQAVLEVDVQTLDAHPHLLNVQNGVVNLRTGALHSHNPALFLTRIAAVDCDPGATHPAWDRALSTVRPGDLAGLHVLAGQAVTGFPGTKAVVIHGSGRSGKTTFVTALAKALGTHTVVGGDLSDFTGVSGNPGLRGARLAVAMEESKLGTRDLKLLLGSREMTARYIRRATMTFRASHTLLAVMNQTPPEPEDEGAPLAPVGLRNLDEVGGADPDLRRSLTEPDALRAVLRWIVDGAVRWYAETREPVRV